MSTVIRPEITKKNKYWISKERYYELKHFCLQYPEWKKEYCVLNESIIRRSSSLDEKVAGGCYMDYVEETAEKLYSISRKIKMVENTAIEAAGDLNSYILKAVTLGYSYDRLRTVDGIPCCREVYYDMYRRFFWLLDIARD